MLNVRSARTRRSAPIASAAVALALALGLGSPAADAASYPGMKLNPSGATYAYSHSGPVFIRIYCPAAASHYCTGRMTLYLGHRRITSAPVASGNYDGPSMEVALPRSFRSLLRHGGRRVRVVMRTHDVLGHYRTTSGFVTIRAPGRGVNPGRGAPPLPPIKPSPAQPEPVVPSPGFFPAAPFYSGLSFGNPPGVFGSNRAGQFGNGRQVVNGNRRYDNPGAVFVDSSEQVWTADTSNNRIQVFSATGQYKRRFGAYGFDPSATRAVLLNRFNNPGAIVVVAGKAYIQDGRNSRIMVWNVAGRARPLRRIGRRGALRGRFTGLAGVALSSDRRQVLGVDAGNFRVERFSLTGRYLGSFGHFGTHRGGFELAGAIATGRDGRIFVIDRMRDVVLVFSSAGRFITEFGGPGAAPGQLNAPEGIAVDPQGRVLVANTVDRRVDRFTENGQFLDSFGYGSYTSASNGVLDRPSAVAVDPHNGAIYVADSGNRQSATHCGRYHVVRQDPCRERRVVIFAPRGQ